MRYILITVILLCLGCDKIIDIDYRSVESKVVISGELTEEISDYDGTRRYFRACNVVITRTQDMDDTTAVEYVKGAKVRLLTEDNEICLELVEVDSLYIFPYIVGYEPLMSYGDNYTIEVEVDGEKYRSTSTYLPPTTVAFKNFRWVKTFGDSGMLFSEAIVQDVAGVDNFYCYKILINGKENSWGVFNDRGNDGMHIPIVAYIPIESEGSKEEDIFISEGDMLTIECKSIDKKSYEYLYSLLISDREYSNPLSIFDNGALGYFYVASLSSVRVNYYAEEVIMP